ncbi:MAG: hypothetical protein KJT03_07370 [Verrucomicrobiae bacterium]|nr:hypothetical protein [Verrucomicrobiae bacterium]
MDYQIADFQATDELRITETEIKKIAFLDLASARSNPEVNFAIVEDVEEILDNMALYLAYMIDSQWDIQTFDSKGEAYQWLEINPKR